MERVSWNDLLNNEQELYTAKWERSILHFE